MTRIHRERDSTHVMPKVHRKGDTKDQSANVSEDNTTAILRQLGNQSVQRFLAQRSDHYPLELDDETANRIYQARNSGQPLDSAIQEKMSNAVGEDFSSIHVHTDPESHALNQQLDARAFTSRQDIFFREGEYQPNTIEGQQLIAHELTHVVQQTSGAVGGSSGKITVNPPGDRFEQEANAVAKEVVSSINSPQVQRQVLDEEEEEVQAKALQLQAEESDKEELEREEQEINCGLQKQSAEDTSNGVLKEEEIAIAKRWYKARRSYYPEDVTRQIQEKVDTPVDGVIGRQTIQAIAKWQLYNNQFVDGKAGLGTLIKMFHKDIRPGVGKATGTVKQSKSGKGEIPQWIYDFFQTLTAFGFTHKQIDAILSEQRSRELPEEDLKPASRPSRYHIEKGEGYFEALDGVSIKPSLLGKMFKLAQYALENDLVKGKIIFNSGMRSPKKAHLWSTAFHIRQGVVPMKALQALPEGRDKDGNVWYKPGWTMKEVQQNAIKAWKGDFAAEGYPLGDERRIPNTYKGGVTRHATGLAIDATFVWKVSSDEEGNSSASLEKLRKDIKKRFAKMPNRLRKILSKIDRFVARGSYGAIAVETVNRFGLKRPALHSISNAEDWHYEEK